MADQANSPPRMRHKSREYFISQMKQENKPKKSLASSFKVSHKRATTRMVVANSPFAVYDYLGLAENPKIKKMLEKHGSGMRRAHAMGQICSSCCNSNLVSKQHFRLT